MADSRKGLEILKQNQNLKPKRNLVNSEEDAVASEEDLDGILRDVEKLEANARCRKDKPKWKPKVEFTQQDEKDLDQIFEDAEKRKKEFDELLDAVKNDGNDDSDDDNDDSSSVRSSSSSDDSSDDSDSDCPYDLLDDLETEDKLKMKTKAVSLQEKELDNEMDRIQEGSKK